MASRSVASRDSGHVTKIGAVPLYPWAAHARLRKKTIGWRAGGEGQCNGRLRPGGQTYAESAWVTQDRCHALRDCSVDVSLERACPRTTRAVTPMAALLLGRSTHLAVQPSSGPSPARKMYRVDVRSSPPVSCADTARSRHAAAASQLLHAVRGVCWLSRARGAEGSAAVTEQCPQAASPARTP